jgi:hypothetical protein
MESGTVARMNRAMMIMSVVAIAAGCGGGGDRQVAERPVCGDLYRPGVTLPDGAEDGSCVDEAGDEVTLANVIHVCENGDELVGNQYGVAWLASERVVIDVDVMTDPDAAEIDAACS